MSACLDPTRAARVSRAAAETFDILIVGGGILGACLARDAAFRGYSVLLLESVDYAFGTSSRSTKLLHGGLRYLEHGDVALVREALLERDILLAAAPHICRSQRAVFPVVSGKSRPAWQMRIGLGLYDLLATDLFRPLSRGAFPRHERLRSDSETVGAFRSLGLSFTDLFAYSDGQMDDTRLVIENIVDAAALGAVTLNHAHVVSMQRGGGKWEVRWQDRLSGETKQSRAKYLMNAGGPWVETLDRAQQPRSGDLPKPRFSRGTHLLFDVDWNLPGLTLPTDVRGTVYFVWPYFSPRKRGVIVGPTHGEVPGNDEDPKPNESEIDQLLGYLARDLPGAGLTKDKLYRAFCGMRVLMPARVKDGLSSQALSRRDHVEEGENAMTILGGKYTTARHTAERSLDTVDRRLGRTTDREKCRELRARLLPGARGWSPDRPSLREKVFLEGGGDMALIARAAASAASSEQAATLDDIILRRLVLWGMPIDLGHVEAELSRLDASFRPGSA